MAIDVSGADWEGRPSADTHRVKSKIKPEIGSEGWQENFHADPISLDLFGRVSDSLGQSAPSLVTEIMPRTFAASQASGPKYYAPRTL
jgi:hypothetical protein